MCVVLPEVYDHPTAYLCYYINYHSYTGPIQINLIRDHPFFERLIPNSCNVHDSNNIIIKRVMKCVNRNMDFPPPLFYDVIYPYLKLEFVYNSRKGTSAVNLLLDNNLVWEHWSQNLLPPSFAHAPLLHYFLNTVNSEFALRVGDNIVPMLSQTLVEETKDVQCSTTPLFPHQKQGVEWMLQLEQRIARNQPVGSLGCNKTVFGPLSWNGEALVLPDDDPQGDSVDLYSMGGMIGDGIGSGKTLEMLNLLVTDLEGLPPIQLTQAAEAVASRGKAPLRSNASLIVCGKQLAEQWKNQLEEHFKHRSFKVVMVTDKLHHERVTYEMLLTADIVIVTMSFLVGEYYRDHFVGYRINPNIAPISIYYGLLLTKWPQSLQQKPLLELITFRRLILDEADMYLHKLHYMDPELEFAYSRRLTQHCRVNSSRRTEPFIYVHCLQSTFRWLVTSTANFHELSQLSAFASFLHLRTSGNDRSVTPLSALGAPRAWSRQQTLCLETAILSGSGLEKWLVKQSFLKHLLLARSQEYIFSSMAMPDLESEVIWVDYSDAERNLVRGALELDQDYNYQRHVHAFPLQLSGGAGQSEEEVANGARVMTVQQASEVMLGTQRQRMLELESLLLTLQSSTLEVERVRQNASEVLIHVLNHRHVQMCQEMKTMEQTISAIQRSMQFLEASLQSEDPCAICLEAPTSMVTPCGHKYCKDCITAALQQRPRCPSCRSPVLLESCITLLSTERNLDNGGKVKADYGSRFQALLQYIQGIKADDPDAQFVVFSEWDKELKKQETLLISEGGYRCAQIKGNTAVCQHHVQQFQSKQMDVLFLSLHSMASGLHLVTANHVILLTPLGAPFNRAEQIERQAIGRCHRVGQTRKVHVRHILVRNSMEEEIWQQRHGHGDESKQ